LAAPGESQPKPAIVILGAQQRNTADELVWFGFQAQRPVPLVASRDGRKGGVAIVSERAIGGIGPRHMAREKLHDFPMGKKFLALRGVGQFERPQFQAGRLQADHSWTS
jgi:hypothetical protein